MTSFESSFMAAIISRILWLLLREREESLAEPLFAVLELTALWAKVEGGDWIRSPEGTLSSLAFLIISKPAAPDTGFPAARASIEPLSTPLVPQAAVSLV